MTITIEQQQPVIKISEIKVNSDNRLRKKHTNIESLAASIESIGLLHPVVIDENNNLIAGYRRIKAYEYLGRTEIPYRSVNIENALQGEYDENVERADFALEDIAAIYEQVRQSRIGHRPHKKQEKGAESTPFPKGKTKEVTAKIAGYSPDKVAKIVAIVNAAKENPAMLSELIQKVDSGQTSVEYAYKQIKRAEDNHNNKERLPLPKEQFDVILADPPWQYDVINTRGIPDEHYYAVMKTEEIMNLDVPIADDAILFLWATAPKLNDAFRVMLTWNFTYKTHAVWIKDRIGTGYYLRGQHELLLIGVRGNIGAPAESNRPSSVINAARAAEHSQKPDKVYDMIEQMYPGRQYLELFARGRPRTGWTTWGLEAQE
jgi:N6-adenosine-specific RNA methylase IME4